MMTMMMMLMLVWLGVGWTMSPTNDFLAAEASTTPKSSTFSSTASPASTCQV